MYFQNISFLFSLFHEICHQKKNSIFLFDDNYCNFHSVHQPENDINYINFSWYFCESRIKNKWIERLLYIVLIDNVPIFLHHEICNQKTIVVFVCKNYGNFHILHQPENDINYCHFSCLFCKFLIKKRLKSLFCVVSKDILPLLISSWYLPPINNSSSLFDDNYGNFHSEHQTENDINYWHFSWYYCELRIKNTWIESLLCVFSKYIIPIFPFSWNLPPKKK